MRVDGFGRFAARCGCLYVVALLTVGLLLSPAVAVVTSDAAGTHRVTPGEPAFGVDLDGVTFLPLEDPVAVDNDPTMFSHVCTVALITDRHLITAAQRFRLGRHGDSHARREFSGIHHLSNEW